MRGLLMRVARSRETIGANSRSLPRMFGLALMVVMATLVMAAVQARAQTNDENLTIPTFYQSAVSYFTSFNTNYTFAGTSLELGTGYKQVTGVGAASVLDGQYNLPLGGASSTIGNRLHIGASAQFSGVG
ncbi:MAG: hypothetical protein ACRED1_08350, partial [Limisphaerales bacterium]